MAAPPALRLTQPDRPDHDDDETQQVVDLRVPNVPPAPIVPAQRDVDLQATSPRPPRHDLVNPPPLAEPVATSPPGFPAQPTPDPAVAARSGADHSEPIQPVPAPTTVDPGARPTDSHLADRALLATLPAIAVLVVTLVVAALVGSTAQSLFRQSAELQGATADQREAQASVERLDAGVLGLVAGGVGQVVVDLDEVQRDLGQVRSSTTEGAPPISELDGEYAAAAASRAEYLDAVEDALARSGDSPVELGNELSDLEELRVAATSDADAYVDALADRADDAASDARGRAAVVVVVVVLGLVVASVALLAARARLTRRLDRPVQRMRSAVAQFDAGRAAVAVDPGGMAELTSLGAELDRTFTGLDGRIARLRHRADWGDQSRMIFEALDLADDEEHALAVVGQALGLVGGDRPVELLLSDRGSSRLHAVAANESVAPPGCQVDSTAACVALRRGQVSLFESSESINTCPKLRGRPGGPCSAVCVPVTVAARPVGVLHMTGPDGQPPNPDVVEQLVTLSGQLGNRFGALRTLESSRQEASTDGLTGLPNRRTLESEVADLVERGTPFVMVLADLDKFKKLNDNFGHEVGDKALQLFAGVLRDNVRGNDVVARLGGEEFVLVYPNMSVEISIEAIDRLRSALARAIGASRIPPFTCSFGVAHSSVGIDGDSILRVADAGLLRAKDLGGDQAVFADEELTATIFAEDSGHNAARSDDADR